MQKGPLAADDIVILYRMLGSPFLCQKEDSLYVMISLIMLGGLCSLLHNLTNLLIEAPWPFT